MRLPIRGAVEGRQPAKQGVLGVCGLLEEQRLAQEENVAATDMLVAVPLPHTVAEPEPMGPQQPSQ